jgi:hypothetical protein
LPSTTTTTIEVYESSNDGGGGDESSQSEESAPSQEPAPSVATTTIPPSTTTTTTTVTTTTVAPVVIDIAPSPKPVEFKQTIICRKFKKNIKGKLFVKVVSVQPKCPKGYRLKKCSLNPTERLVSIKANESLKRTCTKTVK